MKTRHLDPVLHDRDPMLAHAVAAHGAAWRPDLQSIMQLADAGTVDRPSVTLRAYDHRLHWQTGDAQVILTQRWREFSHGRWGWDVTLTTTARFCDTVGGALVGRTLDALIDAPGASAWLIEDVLDGPSMSLVRLRRDGMRS